MFEGKELEGNIGNVATYSLDIDDKGFIEIKLGAGNVQTSGIEGGAYVKSDILVLLEKLAQKSSNNVDDALVAKVKEALGRK